MIYVSRTLLAAQYTGNNSAELLDVVKAINMGNTWTVASADDQVCVLREVNSTGLEATWPVATGTWLLVAPDFGVSARLSDATFKARYRSLDTIVNEAVARGGGIGVANVPAILGNATVVVSVRVAPAQPDLNYTATAVLSGSASLLASLSITGEPVKVTTTRVDVSVKNTGLLTLSGALLIVHATPGPITLAAPR